MNAIQFIKEHGVDKAREVIDGAPEFPVFGYCALTGSYIFKRKDATAYYHNETNSWSEEYAIELISLEELKRLVDDIDLLIEHSLSGCWGIEDKYGIEGTGMYLEGYAFYSNEEEKAELDRLQEALNRTVKAFGGEHV